MHWWERQKTERERQGWTFAELERRTGINRKLLSKYEEGLVQNPRGSAVARIAGAFDLSEEEFRGYGGRSHKQPRRVPVMSLRAFTALKRGRNPLDVWDGVSSEAAGEGSSEGDFLVTLDDDSNAPQFNANERVICNKAAQVTPGCYVIAVLEKSKTPVFRRYRPLGMGDKAPFKLIAANPDYPEIEVGPDNPGFIVARATKHIRDI